MVANDDSKEEMVGMFFSFCYFFQIFQKNELTFGRTLDLSSINDDSQILKILLGPWNEQNTSAKFFNLSSDEIYDINLLARKREELNNRIQREVADAAKVAIETENEWDIFLEVFNYYAKQEAEAVAQVCNKDLGRLEKLDAITSFLTVFSNVTQDSCKVNGVDIELDKILTAVEKRMQHAPAHCIVNDESNHSFRLGLTGSSTLK